MYTKKDIIKDTNSGFVIDSKSFYYIIKNEVLEYEGSKVLEVNGRAIKLMKYNNFLYVEYFSNEDGFERNEQFDISTGTKVDNEFIYKSVLFSTTDEDFCFIIKSDGNHNFFLSVYDLKLNKVYAKTCKNPFRFHLSDDKVIFFPNKNLCNCTSYKNKSFKWQFDSSRLPPFKDPEGVEYQPEFVNIIGVYNGVVWLREKYGRLVGIDITTGNLVHNLPFNELVGLPRFEPIEDCIIFGDIHLDEQNGIIKSLSYRHYWEIDLNTLTGQVKKDFGSVCKTSWRIQRSRYYKGDKNLYFIGTRTGEILNRAVGIFDTEQCEIIWYDEPLEQRKFLSFTDIPQANATLLGVLDSERNLWIYERDVI